MSSYSAFEERLNVYTHLVGAILGLLALVLLAIKSSGEYSAKSAMSFVIFGLGIITMFGASTLYHKTKDERLRLKRKVLDHCAIYIMIAGTYSPFALVAIGGDTGWLIFGTSWALAITGIYLKLHFVGRFKLLSTLIYVLMGWMIIFFVRPLTEAISSDGFNLLLSGGILYTIGAVVYMIKKIKLNHAIFHVFVLGGSISHFFCIYLFV